MGSPQAAVLRLLLAKKEKMEMSKVLFLGRASARPDSLSEAWADFVSDAYPWVAAAAAQEAERAKAALAQAKPMVVRPLPTMTEKVRSVQRERRAQQVRDQRSRRSKG